jgi:NAD(P)H-dependent flavin oxidoreductase YrpB (nitropropane dioxygenase family)
MAGGIGFVGTGGQNPNQALHYVGVGDMVTKLRKAKSLANEHSDTIGLGLTIEGCLDKDAPILDQVLTQDPKNLWLSCFSDTGSTKFGPFVRLARSTRLPCNVFVQVKSAEEAKLAAMTGAHVVVLQGKGSGGFISPQNLEKEGRAGTAGKEDKEPFPGDPLEIDFPSSFDTDVEGYLEHEFDVKSPLFKKAIQYPPIAYPYPPADPRPDPRYPLQTLIPDSIKAIAELNLDHPPMIAAAGGISTGYDIYQCMQLGADAVVIGTLFAVARESELSIDEKLAFAEGSMIPQTTLGTLTRKNPDGSTVRVGDSSSFRFAGERKNVLYDYVNAPASDIVDELMEEYYKQEVVQAAIQGD